jgi:hypothetical protein
VARLGSKVPDDASVDDDPDLLNFTMAVPWIGCWMSFQSQKYWPDLGKPDGLVVTPNADLAISVFSQEAVEGGFWMRSWLASLVLLPSTNFWIFGPDHPRPSLFSYDDLFAIGRLGLRWPNQDLAPLELDRAHVSLEQIFIKLHLGIFSKLQLSFDH